MHAAYRSLTGRLSVLAAAPRLSTTAWSSKLSLTGKLRPLVYVSQRRANSNDPTVDLPALDRAWRTRWAAIPPSPPKTPTAGQEKPKYILPMFPYPSGTLHMGHLRVYTIADVLARYHKLTGKEVINCMGWDAFGLPAENAAIERRVNPATWTKENIAKMKQQLVLMNGTWDWSREISTCDPEFYKHTQYIFTLLHEMGLAYQAEAEVNYDPVDMTVLADEQVDSNGCSWRSGAKVEKRKLKQWFLKISEFREELLNDLDVLAKNEAWPSSVLSQQRNWLGKSIGATVKFHLMHLGHDLGAAATIDVFTTRLETLFGVQYLALSPTHPLVVKLAKKDTELQAFLDSRPGLPTEAKAGYLLPNIRAINPLGYDEDSPDEIKTSIPIYVAHYVVGDYGEGAVMGVPGHDVRDHGFWMQHNHTEPVRVVVAASEDESTQVMLNRPFEPFVDHGIMTAAGGLYKGMTSKETAKRLLAKLEKEGGAKAVEKWRLRDWLISRQRYWGAPIPIIHCMSCGAVPVPKEHLPVLLPNVDDHFKQKQTGNPLQAAQEWWDVGCPKCGGAAKRDTDTMDTFVDSSWYFMRFADPHNTDAPFASDKIKAHLPVDLYIGGTEHAILHLLYARFIYKALMGSTLMRGEDEVVTEVQEPFTRLIAQGMVLGKTHTDPHTKKFLKPHEIDTVSNPLQVAWSGHKVKTTYEKMSKSKYNGVDPTDVLHKHGADATRAHILFSAPVKDELFWDETKITGVTRWLQRVHEMVAVAAQLPSLPDGETPRTYLEKQLQSLDRKAPGQMARWDSNCAVWGKVQMAIEIITASYERVLNLNTVISDLMDLTNNISRNPLALEVEPGIERAAVEALIQMLAPIAPTTAEEAWLALHPGGAPSIFQSGKFPTVDGSLVFVKPRNLTCSIQVNGKFKSVAVVPLPPPGLTPEALRVWLTAEILRTVEGLGQTSLGTTIRTAKKSFVVEGGKTMNFVV